MKINKLGQVELVNAEGVSRSFHPIDAKDAMTGGEWFAPEDVLEEVGPEQEPPQEGESPPAVRAGGRAKK